MLVNPFLLLLAVVLIVSVIAFYVIKRPMKPYLSGVFLALLALFIGCTAVINSALSPMPNFDWANEQMQRLAPFVVFRKRPSPDELAVAFERFKTIDIVLFAGMALSVAYDVWNSLLRNIGSNKSE